ncbi:MAG: FAD/NAD(P)-binding protein [Allosphingosinicella sp.]|uniref:FAD/NAD(P)-binding protein n=1 Tax=Allosphingosinicella sp. TaxID=2823234 RepID=UPI003939DDEF
MKTAAVVGGGFSGTLQAIQLVRAGVTRVVLIEREGAPGRGVAYGTARPEHLLNVPAAKMSAFPDAPDHFADWFAGHGGAPHEFAPRRLYGSYVEQLLADAGDRIEIVRDEARDILPGEQVVLKSGRRIDADAVVLAVGNFPPGPLRGLSEAELPGIYVPDPWAGDFADGLNDQDDVLLIGTGLTAVDAALTLDAKGFGGRILALSRRGLAPRAHRMMAPVPPLGGEPPATCAALTRAVRRAAEGIGWRAAVDQLRPVTQRLWAEAPLEERRRFLRHLRPWWDVHRHRIAPSIAARIAEMEAAGRLRFAAGRIVAAAADGSVEWRPRGAASSERLRAARIVNCTGPEPNIARAGDPLLDALIASGRIRPDPLRIGIDVDADFRAIGADGEPSETLYAIGPMTRGAFWEIVAVPDIRGQVKALAERLGGRGEGQSA